MNIKQLFSKELLIVLLIVFVAVSYFGLGSLFDPYVGYRSVAYTSDTITYSGVVAPDNNNNLPIHAFRQWNGGNIESFEPFYKNTGLIPFYLDNALNVKSADFTILAGDGDKMMYGTHLKPNYCIPQPASSVLVGMDSNGCPLYDVRSRVTEICACAGGNIYTNLGWSSCWPPGASAPCADRSIYAVTQSNVGGSNSGAKNYKAILEADGWTWDSSQGAWNKGAPSSKIDELATKMTCEVSGSTEVGSYSAVGIVKYQGKNGFSCEVSGVKGSKIIEGVVVFKIGTSPTPVVETPVVEQVSSPIVSTISNIQPMSWLQKLFYKIKQFFNLA